MKVTAGTIARTVVLAVSLLNVLLNAFGKNPLPFSDDEVYTAVSTVVAVVASLAAWWKNNSFTAAAVKADEVLKIEKAEGGTEDEGEQ
jgi:SPP1 family holin